MTKQGRVDALPLHRPAGRLDIGETRQAITNDDGYDFADDFAKSILECYAEIKCRKANGGPGWPNE